MDFCWPKGTPRCFWNWFLGSQLRPHTLMASCSEFLYQHKNLRISKTMCCRRPLWHLEEFIWEISVPLQPWQCLSSSHILTATFLLAASGLPSFVQASPGGKTSPLCNPNNSHKREFLISTLGTQHPSSCYRNSCMRNKEDCLVCKLAILTTGQFWLLSKLHKSWQGFRVTTAT